jgi:hypothetical protein
LKSDGRPILGLDAKELAKIVFNADPKAVVVPAHCWTPQFSRSGRRIPRGAKLKAMRTRWGNPKGDTRQFHDDKRTCWPEQETHGSNPIIIPRGSIAQGHSALAEFMRGLQRLVGRHRLRLSNFLGWNELVSLNWNGCTDEC